MTTTDSYCNPWSIDSQISGTTGLQFQPLLANSFNDVILQDIVQTVQAYSFEQGRVLNYVAIADETPATGNLAGLNIASYSFAGMGNNNAYSDFSGMTNITSLLGCPAFVTQANFTDVAADVAGSMPTWYAGVQPPQSLNNYYKVETLSGRTVEMSQGFMSSYNVWNDWLLILQPSNSTSYGQFVPMVNIDKQSTMTSSQVNTLLGY